MSVGMIVNKFKTEIIQFLPCPDQKVMQVNVGGEVIPLVESIKVLGLIFDYKLSWKPHVESLLLQTMGSNWSEESWI